MTTFNPNLASPNDSGIFGLPYTENEASLVLLPIPWEATTSYGGGTAKGPQAIFHASKQVDLFDIDLGNFYEAGIAMLHESNAIQQWNKIAREAALTVIEGEDSTSHTALTTVNDYSQKLNEYVYAETKKLLAQGKLVGMVGGDHSTPFGGIQAFLEKYPNMGILHFDAHADLRNAFEGFEFSHASIMHNVITKTKLAKLVQVGIRDFCEEEYRFIEENNDRITVFFDAILAEKRMQGKTWDTLCRDIVSALPKEVYISFDIDGLDPQYCPHTGTPVPGGLDFQEALYLIKQVVLSGRTIVGFDLNEVSLGNMDSFVADAASEWDANVGARILYKLCGWTIRCQEAKDHTDQRDLEGETGSNFLR